MIIFWHRKDLRIMDNLGLNYARQNTDKVIGLFCLDSAILSSSDISPSRVLYLLQSLQELINSYEKIGGTFLIFNESPAPFIPVLAQKLQAEAVYWNLDVEPYSKKRDEEIEHLLAKKSIKTNTFWDQLLHAPGEVFTQGNKPYTVYSPFWRNWSAKEKTAPVTAPQTLKKLTPDELKIAEELGAISLPSLEKLGFTWQEELILNGGEKCAQERLDYFVNELLINYDENRNYPALDGTSLLSAPLKFGCISPRILWRYTVESLDNCRSDEEKENIIAWQKELAWREFYQHCLYFFPELAEGAYRQQFKHFPWQNDETKFQAWCEGKTGYPMVDASMRQLNATGWMHNRCRMIVASFLTKDLIIDWRWGEKYFMQKLYDGDLSANNGGWQWSASTGMDPKPLRIFNPASQAQKYDPEAEYIRKWLPEIASLDTSALLTGKITPMDAHTCGYVTAIVDHKQQQGLFKALYNQQKNNYG